MLKCVRNGNPSVNRGLKIQKLCSKSWRSHFCRFSPPSAIQACQGSRNGASRSASSHLQENCTAMRPAVCQLLRSSCHRASIVGRPTLQLRPLIRSPCNPTFRQFCSGRTLRFDRSQASSPLSFDDSTIYALSTAPGKAAIAVVRISGPSCVEVSYVKQISGCIST